MNEGARASDAAMCSVPVRRTTRDQRHTNRTRDSPSGTSILYENKRTGVSFLPELVCCS